ncbi:hypothetical protein [Rhodocyclus tenuis]|uniref:hypothetical protein n=1 Tax=Rhodocyclus tenuis TaxID=1066 RepID=UPI0019059760|nr:hypothetical protein [Rhodocyclus tenuis]
MSSIYHDCSPRKTITAHWADIDFGYHRISKLIENAQFSGSVDAAVTAAVQLATVLPVDFAALV